MNKRSTQTQKSIKQTNKQTNKQPAEQTKASKPKPTKDNQPTKQTKIKTYIKKQQNSENEPIVKT